MARGCVPYLDALVAAAAIRREAEWPVALRRYVPQFDGVRGLAAVVAYHLGHLRCKWAREKAGLLSAWAEARRRTSPVIPQP